MEANKILKSDFLDILFEGRNKEYGAYDLRNTYNKRIKIALASTVIILVLIFVGSVIAQNISSTTDVKEIQTKDLVMEAAPNEPPPPPPRRTVAARRSAPSSDHCRRRPIASPAKGSSSS